MKIHFGTLALGIAAGGVAAWYYAHKVQIPNAFAVGQANPQTPYANLTAAQKAQFSTWPLLPSPPPIGTVVGGAISGITDQTTSPGQVGNQAANQVFGTGALLGRSGNLPIHYNHRRG